MQKTLMYLATMMALAVAAHGSNAVAQHIGNDDIPALAQNDADKRDEAQARAGGGEKEDTIGHLKNAARVVKQMEAEPKLRSLMQQAKGILIVPKYARAALGIGGSGGEGVMMANTGGQWSSPAFYDVGGVSVGAQAGVEVGSVAMLLMSDKAVQNFTKANKFSIDADAGLTIAKYTARASATAGRGDVVVWTDTKGAFASAAIGASDIHFDKSENAAFYKPGVTAGDIIDGKVKSRQGDALIAAMPKPSASASGKSSAGKESDSSKDK